MDSRALAKRLQACRATAVESRHARRSRAAAKNVQRKREPTVEAQAKRIIAGVLKELNKPRHRAGREIEVVRANHPAAGRVFNLLMAAARSSKARSYWYPVEEEDVNIFDEHYRVIKLRFGRCSDAAELDIDPGR